MRTRLFKGPLLPSMQSRRFTGFLGRPVARGVIDEEDYAESARARIDHAFQARLREKILRRNDQLHEEQSKDNR